MSLQGSLETFALPDVMVLLASTKKDGELHVSGAKLEGHIWVEKGEIVHSDVNGREVSSVDAVFDLLRLDAGSFVFEADRPAPARHDPETIDAVLADAQVRLAEWKEIAKVVPHLDVRVDMASKAPGEQVTISASDWRLLRAVAGGSTVAALMAAEEITEFDACRAVKAMFEADLVSLDLTAGPKPQPTPERADAPAGVQKRPADMPTPAGEQRDAAPAAPPSSDAESGRPDAKRVEEVKSEVERELAALVDEAAKEPARPKVRATTNTPGSIATDAPTPRNGSARIAEAKSDTKMGDGKGSEPKPEEREALVAQLAALEGENPEKIAKKVEEHLARGGELPEVGEGDEPINRGLLLKFLSSVRN